MLNLKKDPDDITPSDKGIKLIFSYLQNAKLFIQKIKEKGIYPLLKATGSGNEKSEISSSDSKDFFIVEIDKKDCFAFFENQKNRNWFEEPFHDQQVHVIAFKNLGEASNFLEYNEQNEIKILKNSQGNPTPEERERNEFIVTYSFSAYQQYENKRILKVRLPEARWRLAKDKMNSIYEAVFDKDTAAKDFVESLSKSKIYDTGRGSVNKSIVKEHVVRYNFKNYRKLFKKLESFDSFVDKEQQYGIQLKYLCKFIKDKCADNVIEKIIEFPLKSNKLKLQEIIKIVKGIYKNTWDELQYKKLFEGFIAKYNIPSLKTKFGNETDTSKEVTRLQALKCTSNERLDRFIPFAKEREEAFFGGIFRKQDSEDMLKAANQLPTGMQLIQKAELTIDKELELSDIFSKILDFEKLLADIAGGDERSDNIFEIVPKKLVIKTETENQTTIEQTFFFPPQSLPLGEIPINHGQLVAHMQQSIGNPQQIPFNGQSIPQGYPPNHGYFPNPQQPTGYPMPIYQQPSQQYGNSQQFVTQNSNWGGGSNFFQAALPTNPHYNPQATPSQNQQLQSSAPFVPVPGGY